MRTNLSEIGNTYRLVFDGPDGPEYWCGGDNWTKDPEHSFSTINYLGEEASVYWLNWLNNRRGVVARAEKIQGNYILYKWPDYGWVVINNRYKSATIHKVYVAHNYGDGWFVKDQGTVEQTLGIRLSSTAFQDVVFAGERIVDVTLNVDGEAIKHFESISIRDDSNLKYHFEFDAIPVENMEVE